MATVSNPYQFKISKPTSFSTTLIPSLPTVETTLFSWEGAFFDDNPIILKIPLGVSVLKTLVYVSEDTSEDNPSQTNLIGGSAWNSSSANFGDYESSTKYIGVTPGKEYKLTLETTDAAMAAYHECKISYSAEINTHTPDVTDY